MPHPSSQIRKQPTNIATTWRNYETGLSSPPISPSASWCYEPNSYLHLLQRAYISLVQHCKDTGLLDDIQRFLSENEEPTSENPNKATEQGIFDMDQTMSPSISVMSYTHREDLCNRLDFALKNSIPSSRRASNYTTFQSHIYDQMSVTTTSSAGTDTADNLWNQFKQQILDLQAENNNILSLVVDSEVKLKNAAANIVDFEEECALSEEQVMLPEEEANYFQEQATVKSRVDRNRLSCYDEVIPPSPTEMALRTLLNTCKETEETRNVLDDTLSLLNRGYDDKGFRCDIRRILGSGLESKPIQESETLMDILIRWVRFLVILFLSVIICILNGPSGLGDQR